jgi:transposase IS116/IS110/IS902 family protein
VLETANVKLTAVATDVLGKSGRAMLEALVKGATDPEILAELARGRLRQKLPQLQEALDGRVEPHHRLLLKHILAHIAFLEETLEQLQRDIEERLHPFEEAMTLLMSIPGIQALAAATIVGEIGDEMTRFPSAKHLVSWAGVCPGNKPARGQTTQRQDDPRQCHVTCHAGRSGLGALAQERYLSFRPVPPLGTSSREEESGHGGFPQPSGDHLSGPLYQATLLRSGGRLLRATR